MFFILTVNQRLEQCTVVIIALTWTNGWLNRLKCAVMCHIEINEANNVKVPASYGR